MTKQNKARILVVDDEEVTTNLLRDFLTDLGYRVEVAKTGEDALKAAQESPFDLVITDVRMPGISGIELIQAVSDINIDTCFVVITGYASLETAIAAVKGGAYDYVSKPFNLEEFRIIIERAIERQSLMRQAREKEYYRELSILDGLTQLYNHRYFHELMNREINRSIRYPQDFSIMMIDIDDFKRFNEAHGHLSGDCALKNISQIMLNSVRRVDLISRYGGEEFVIIMPHTNKEGANIAAKRLLDKIKNADIRDEKSQVLGRLTVSIGIASYPRDGQSKENLIKAADEALTKAKKEGKNRINIA